MKKQVGMNMVKIHCIYIKLKYVFCRCFSNIFTLLLIHFLLLIFIFVCVFLVCVSTGVYVTQNRRRSELPCMSILAFSLVK